MGLRYFLVSAQNDPFEPDPVDTGVGKGTKHPPVYSPIPSPVAGSELTKIEIQDDKTKIYPATRRLC